MNDFFKTYAPLLARQALFAAGVYLTTKGIISTEQSAWISGNVDVLAGLLLAGVVFAVQLVIRPSARALDAAKAIDETLPDHAPAIIKTPEGLPDIVIPAKK